MKNSPLLASFRTHASWVHVCAYGVLAAELELEKHNNRVFQSQRRKECKKEVEEENHEDYSDPNTPFGEKKNLSGQMAKTYNPSAVQNSRYEWWEKSNFFEADPKSSKQPFVIVSFLKSPHLKSYLGATFSIKGGLKVEETS
ncbi:hypothetical protein BUALT_Bualt03G0190300 [Buddleja alternifolia]|uniref:Uncharacterized protein n=1 Tax=Buddleja alternifolia TaxID=168488 RepID=A0AAV6XVX3_9LAMI|nr:hypothetical protein BUALT_Bualt03G0190300 [Buddleja alternifolia]